ncbi:hypothetical protein BJV78DRAFT_577223 [Lactifluus subvellereus]|nr:hypothetical protein BJV78DRAFT_577223 [Lactifluus subvellereus]
MIAKMAQISGLVTVVVERRGIEEKILGGALWLPPGVGMNPSLFTLVRISPWQALWNWGRDAFKRILADYMPTTEKMLNEVFAARGVKRLDSWHLLVIAIDPRYEGNGYCSLLIEDGFRRASGMPVHVEATTPRSRDIYAHYGFELNNVHRFGMGWVDEMGKRATRPNAAGWPDFIMTKWETPVILYQNMDT